MHPGSCKQNVPPALAVFDDTTSAAIISYFPDRKDAARFLQLINKWWKISNSKKRFNRSDSIGNAATQDDKKPEFLRAFSNWIFEWKNSKIKNCEKFQLSKQTSDALIQTLRCHASLIEDLLNSGKYDYVLTGRFQSDPIERRFSRYRQMSGGRFLVSWKDVNRSEMILKLKTLLKADCNIEEAMSVITDQEKKEALKEIDDKISVTDVEQYSLHSSSREVSNMVAGYVARKTRPLVVNCCEEKLIGECADDDYIKLLTRGGLLVPSQDLSDAVATCFALLEEFGDEIRKCALNTRVVAEHVLVNCLPKTDICCDLHKEIVYHKVFRTIVNIFLNNQTKRKAEDIIEDKVQNFKKSKLEKRFR